jgi:hypothetical protein
MSPSIRASRETDRLLRQALVKVFALKLATGTTLDSLRSFAVACVAEAAKDQESKNINTSLDIHGLASVLRTWHRDSRFLANNGKPRPLLVEGKYGLQTLVRIHYPRHKFRDVLITLSRSKLVRKKKDGHWIPTETHARVPMPTAESVVHFAEGIARLAETFTQNTTSSTKGSLLFERASKVPRLPVGESKEFKKFAEAQGIAFLSAIDDWLESRNLKKGMPGRRTCPAGVYAFAFLGKPNRVRRVRRDADH